MLHKDNDFHNENCNQCDLHVGYVMVDMNSFSFCNMSFFLSCAAVALSL